MAEATLTEEVVQPPEAVAGITPESVAESAPPPENLEAPAAEEAVGKALAESIWQAVAKDAPEDGNKAAPDGAPAGPTADQIAANVRAQVESENRHKGLKWVALEDSPAKLWALADQLDEAGQRVLATEINRIKGAVQPLADKAVDVDANYVPQVKQQAAREAEAYGLSRFAEVVKADLGEAEAQKFLGAGHGSWDDVGKYLGKAYRQNYVHKDVVTKTLAEKFDAYDNELKSRAAQGIITASLKELDGTGGTDVPKPTATGNGARAGTLEWALDAPVDQLIADRARRNAG